jgi:hypothetical protein
MNGEDVIMPCEVDSESNDQLEFLRGSCSASCASAYTVFWDLCEIQYTNPASDYWLGTDSVHQFQIFYEIL